ncbi:hypothetical protein GBAR_LOCUS24668 [Geodia barretti]|uniref:Uncharacterized protein n=1 Tax=Geodia barretti TaxID=519541 RepID=A0AA35TA08_GEOBA|nr:hypothetical protein GBAR_LOCUS24668 [Geodia barretti]
MPGRRKKTRIFHVNMLQKWNAPVCSGFCNELLWLVEVYPALAAWPRGVLG